MSYEALLDLIRNRFSPAEGQTLLRSLQQDPLVWQFFTEIGKSQSYFEAAPADLSAFEPGRMAISQIENTAEIQLGDLSELETALPNQIKQQAAQALETVFNTGLPPSDLMAAGLIALTLRERRIKNESWTGVAEEIFIKKNQATSEKNFKIWRTPITCLQSLCPDFESFIADFMQSKSPTTLRASIPLFLHAYLAQPVLEADLTDQFFTAMQSLPMEMQLEGMKWLGVFHQTALQENLAKNLIQTKANIDRFARIYAELEASKAIFPDSDPLDTPVRYNLAEDINRMAAFYFYSGNPEKAADTYQESEAVLKFIEAQTLFQSLSIQKEHTSPTKWLKLLQSVPNSNQARAFYIRALVDNGEFDEARKHLKDLPASLEKQLLDRELSDQKNESSKPIDFQGFQIDQPVPPKSDFYVHTAKLDSFQTVIKSVMMSDTPKTGETIVEKILESNPGDVTLLKQGREYFEKVQDIEKATQLTSLLERLEPDQREHKRDLARLYSKEGRWERAFEVLQGLTKSETAPSIAELESFAESALKTNRVDMSIAICHNILKQNDKNTKALVLLGEGFMMNGDAVKAIQHMEQVVEMLPGEPDTWLTLAKLWEGYGQSDRAVEILVKGNQAVPSEPKLLLATGKAYLKQQLPLDAQPVLQKAFEIDPENEEVKLYLAQAHHLVGQNDQAWTLLTPFLQDYDDKPFAAKLLGSVLLAREEKALAEPILLRAAELAPEDLSVALMAADVTISRADASYDNTQMVDYERIASILNNAQVSSSEHQIIKIYLADLDRIQGNHQKAFETYSQLLENSPENGLDQYWRLKFGFGKSAIATGKLEIGLAALQDETSKNPDNLFLLHALAEAYQIADLPGKAQSSAKTALKLAPQSIENILWYANFKTAHNEPEEAVRALKDALQIDPERPSLKLWLSKTLISTGSMEEAKAVLVELISGQKANPQELHQAAYVCVHLNELELAAASMEKSLALTKSFNPDLVKDLAVVYSLLEKQKRALEILALPENELRAFPELAILKSDLHSQIGQYRLAEDTLKSIEDKIADALPVQHQSSDAESRSPLLYHYDFSQTGYLYRLAELNRVMGDIKSAQLNYSKALANQPEDAHLRNAAAEAYLIGLDFDTALEIVNGQTFSNDMTPDHVNLLCTQAEINFLQNDAEAATQLFAQHPPQDGNHPRVLSVQSQIAESLGNVELAKEYLNQAINTYEKSLLPKPSNQLDILFKQTITEHSIAEAALRMGFHATAMEYRKQSEQKLSNQPLFSLRYLVTLIKSGEAQRIAEAALITNHAPGNEILSEAHYQQYKQLYNRVEDLLSQDSKICLKARAESVFKGHWPLHLSADACLVNAEEAAAVVLGSDDRALVENILATYPDDLNVLQAFGIYALRNNRREGIQAIEKALTLDTSNPVNHAILGLLNRDHPEPALHSLKSALSFWPDEPEWHALVADLLARIGNPDEAEYHINQAINHQPENPDFWQKSAEIKLQTNDLVRAKEDLERSVTIQSKNPVVWIKMADVNRRLGFVSEAIENMRTASTLCPNDEDIATQEVKFLIDQKQYKDAEQKTTKILEANPKNISVRILAARALSNQGKFEQASKTLTDALEKNPGNPELTLEKCCIKKQQEGVTKALPELIQLAHDHPKHPQILTTLTDWLIQANRLDEAAETAQTVLRIIPDQAEVHLMLGRLQKKKGQLDQAIAHLSKAITYDPNLVEAYIELGKTYQDRHNMEEAIKVFQQGAKADASDPRPYYFAGLALKECKDYTNAEAMLRQAKKYSPDDANVIRQLGVITALNLINNLREAS